MFWILTTLRQESNKLKLCLYLFIFFPIFPSKILFFNICPVKSPPFFCYTKMYWKYWFNCAIKIWQATIYNSQQQREPPQKSTLCFYQDDIGKFQSQFKMYLQNLGNEKKFAESFEYCIMIQRRSQNWLLRGEEVMIMNFLFARNLLKNGFLSSRFFIHIVNGFCRYHFPFF